MIVEWMCVVIEGYGGPHRDILDVEVMEMKLLLVSIPEVG